MRINIFLVGCCTNEFMNALILYLHGRGMALVSVENQERLSRYHFSLRAPPAQSLALEEVMVWVRALSVLPTKEDRLEVPSQVATPFSTIWTEDLRMHLLKTTSSSSLRCWPALMSGKRSSLDLEKLASLADQIESFSRHHSPPTLVWFRSENYSRKLKPLIRLHLSRCSFDHGVMFFDRANYTPTFMQIISRTQLNAINHQHLTTAN